MTEKSNKVARIQSLIEEALQLLRPEIEKAKAGEDSVDSLRSLTFIRDRLQQMKENLSSGSKSGDGRFGSGTMTHFVVDTWPLKHVLRDKISEAEYLYFRLR